MKRGRLPTRTNTHRFTTAYHNPPTQMTAGAMEAAINAGEHIQIEMTACRLKV